MTTEEWKIVLTTVPLVVGAFTLLFLAPIAGNRFFTRQAERSLEKAFVGLEFLPQDDPKAVSVTFHSYYGLVVWTRQTKHECCASPEDARELLKRLVRFNLKWGIWGVGAAFVPFLTLIEFAKMSRSVTAQAARRRG